MLRKRSCPNLRQFFGAAHGNVDTNNVFAEDKPKPVVTEMVTANAATRMSVDSTNNDSNLKLDQGMLFLFLSTRGFIYFCLFFK